MMKLSLRRKKNSKQNPKSNKSFDQKKWIRGFTIAAVLIWVFYSFVIDYMPDFVAEFFQKWFPATTVNESLVWVICALGLNIVVGYAGLLDLGFVAFWAIGGYCAGWFMSDFFHQVNIHAGSTSPVTQNGIHLSFWSVLVIGGLVAAAFGIIIGAPTLRLKSDYLALVTLGFGEIIPQIFYNGENIAGFNLSNGSKGISPIDNIGLFGKTLNPFDLDWKYLIFVCLAALMVFISLRIRSGRLGRAWLAIREDELAASMMGVPLMRSKLSAYAVGAFSGGIGGVAFATHVNGVFADRFSFAISIILLAMVVLGGMGNVWGVIIGALAIAWVNATGLPAFGDTVNNALGTNINFPSYNFLLFGGVLIFMMLYKREGLLPESRLKELLHETDDETSNTGGH
jgi:branched-chain amino acid transport system permease protein